MNSSGQLKVIGTVRTGGNVLVLTSVPRAPADWLGDKAAPPPVVDERTHLIELAGKRPRYAGALDGRVRNVWQSENGTVYATGTRGELRILEGQHWRIEQLGGAEEPLGWIWGVSAPKPADDFLVVVWDKGPRVSVRKGGKWSELALPEDANSLWHVHGTAADAFYLLADVGILLCDGKTVSELEGPGDELMGLLALPNGDLHVTGEEGLHVWSEADQEWSLQESPAELTIGIIRHQEQTFLASTEGVLRFDGAEIASDTTGFYPNTLCEVSSDLFAKGADVGLWRKHDGVWNAVELPLSLIPKVVSDSGR